jgi:V8-like Glu-specific endopeptidase
VDKSSRLIYKLNVFNKEIQPCLALLLLICVQGLVLPPSSFASIHGTDHRVRVNDTTQYPYSAVGWTGSCTASVIGKNLVLTAAHCLDGIVLDVSKFIPGYQGPYENDKPYGEYTIRKTIVSKQWESTTLSTFWESQVSAIGQKNALEGNRETKDIAILVVDDMPIKKIKQFELPRQNQAVFDFENKSAAERLVLSYAARLDRTDFGVQKSQSCSVLLAKSPDDDKAYPFLYADCDTLGGDSGSALLVKSNTGKYLISGSLHGSVHSDEVVAPFTTGEITEDDLIDRASAYSTTFSSLTDELISQLTPAQQAQIHYSVPAGM